MSRPHDGQRTFFPFGNPFRVILPKGSYLSPKLLALLNSFEQNLSDSLRKLKPKEKSDSLTLSWMRQAIESLSETHTNIKTLITDLQFPISDWDEKWMDIYLDDSVKLLDICIALSSEISRLDQGQLLLQYVLHVLDLLSISFPPPEQLRRVRASLYDWMQQTNSRSPKLENCSAILQGLAQSLSSAKVKNSAKGKVLMRALYGVKVKTIFVCGGVTAALSGCSELLTELHIPDKFIWAEPLCDLQTDVVGMIRSQLSHKKITVLELEAVEKCVEKLHLLSSRDFGCEDEIIQQSNGDCHMTATPDKTISKEEVAVALEHTNNVCNKETVTLVKQNIDNWQESVQELSKSTEKLTGGLDSLSKQVGDFFQIVLTGRDALLCNLRAPDVAQECKENKV